MKASEIEVELHSTEESAVEATRNTLLMLCAMLFERDGRWFLSTTNPGYVAFAAESQGYVRRVIRPAADTEDKGNG